MKQCSIPGCDKEALSRGWCPRHYQCWRRHGDPNHVSLRKPRQTTSTGHTFLGYHKVRWEPLLWGKWLRDLVETNPHQQHLAAGIAQFRGMMAELESKTDRRFP